MLALRRWYPPAARLAPATFRQVRGSARTAHLREIAQYWMHMDQGRLPVRYLAEIWPLSSEDRAQVAMDIRHPWVLPYGERAILDVLVRHLQPRTIFEFGTFTGATTRLLADAAGTGAVVDTIDLPDAELAALSDWAGADIAAMIGREFRGVAAYEGRIRPHRANSRGFDYRAFAGTVDLVFVDASHEYADVRHDSLRALALLSPRGVIVWDDYHWSHPGVVRALNELARSRRLVRIATSRLVVFRADQPC